MGGLRGREVVGDNRMSWFWTLSEPTFSTQPVLIINVSLATFDYLQLPFLTEKSPKSTWTCPKLLDNQTISLHVLEPIYSFTKICLHKMFKSNWLDVIKLTLLIYTTIFHIIIQSIIARLEFHFKK